MVADALCFAVCAWLVTYLLHSTLLIFGAWACGALLSKVRGCQDSIVLVRERLWKLALFGGIFTASLSTVFDGESWSSRWFLSAARNDVVAERAIDSPIVESAPTLALVSAHEVIEPSIPAARSVPVPKRPTAPSAHKPRSVASNVVQPSSVVPPAHEERINAFPASVAPVTTQAPPVTTRAPDESPPMGALRPSTSINPPWVRALVALWIVGVLLGCAVWAMEWAHLFRLLKGRKALVRGQVYELFARLRKTSGVAEAVRLSITPRLAGPITLGIKGAEICLPLRVERDLRSEELEAMLAHELAHAVRRDPAWLAACRAIEILFFFQPLNRIARRELQDQAEFLCDDWAVVHLGTRVPLASCLTEIATWIVNERRALPAPSMVVHGSRLTHRVERLLDETHRPERTREQRALWVASGLAFAGVVLCAPSVSARVEHERNAATPVPSKSAQPASTTTPPISRADAPARPDPTPSPDANALVRSEADSTNREAPYAPELTFDAIVLESEIDTLEQEFAELERIAAQRGAPEELRQGIARIAARLEALRAGRAELEQEIELAVEEELTSNTPDAHDLGEAGPPDSVPSPTIPSWTHDNETKEMP